MLTKLRIFFICLILSLVPTILIWVPFFLGIESVWGIPVKSGGMATIIQNYDGPLYIAIAKTFYNPDLLSNFSFNLPFEYYPAHFPLFPLFIKLVAPLIGTYTYSMLIVTCLGSIFAIFYFYQYCEKFISKKNALLLTFVFSIFPARWLIVRSVGSPEPLFVGAIIASIYYFKSQKYWLAALFGVIAQALKSPGILLFLSYLVSIIWPGLELGAKTSAKNIIKAIKWRAYPVFLIPATLIAIFIFYYVQTGDFFAYFNSGDNIHLFFPPFQIFNYSQPWVQTHWLEEVIFVYLLSLISIIKLWKQKDFVSLSFVVIFFTTIIFVSHRDIIRYSLPIVPFMISSFSKEIGDKYFLPIFLFLVLPIYLFSIAYISQNYIEISNWAPLL